MTHVVCVCGLQCLLLACIVALACWVCTLASQDCGGDLFGAGRMQTIDFQNGVACSLAVKPGLCKVLCLISSFCLLASNLAPAFI